MKNSCPLCKSYNSDVVSRITRDGVGTVLKCKVCKHVYLDLGIDIEQIEFFLNDFYEQDSQRKPHIDDHDQYIEKIKEDSLRRLSYCQTFINTKLRVLDFGAGYCLFSYLIKPFVSEVTVVDRSRLTQENAKRFGLSYAYDFAEVNELYDIIFSFHSLEHVIDPIDILKQFVDKLQDDGLVVIEVPNHNDFLMKASKRYRPFYYQTAHLHYFSLKTLKMTAMNAGLRLDKLISTQRYGLQNHLGWILNQQYEDIRPLEFVYKSILSHTFWRDTIFCVFKKNKRG